MYIVTVNVVHYANPNVAHSRGPSERRKRGATGCVLLLFSPTAMSKDLLSRFEAGSKSLLLIHWVPWDLFLSLLNLGFSRVHLHTDLFTRNLHFAGSFWEEHRLNVKELFSKVMSQENLVRICENAARLCLTFNEQAKWIPAEYNRSSLLTGLRTKLILPRRGHLGCHLFFSFFFFVTDAFFA
jgi:hypothetical protein